MTRENGVLAAEIRVFSHVVVGEFLYVGLGVTPVPRFVYGCLTSLLSLLDGISET